MITTPTHRRAAFALRFAAIIPCLLALPLFVAAGWPLAGWGLSAILLVANIGAAFGFDLLARGRSQTMQVGIVGVGLLSRAWLTFGALFIIAWTVDREVGVVAAAAFLVYFTVDLVARSISHVLLRAPESGPVAAPETS